MDALVIIAVILVCIFVAVIMYGLWDLAMVIKLLLDTHGEHSEDTDDK